VAYGERRTSSDARIGPRRFAVRARKHDKVTVGITQPDLAMIWPARPVWRIPVRRENNLGVKLRRPLDCVVEVVDLEPQCHTVAVWPRRGIADLPMVMLDIEAVKLQHECSVAEQAFVLIAAVPALASEQLPVPTTAPRDVCDRDQGLRAHSVINVSCLPRTA